MMHDYYLRLDRNFHFTRKGNDSQFSGHQVKVPLIYGIVSVLPLAEQGHGGQ